MEQRHQRLLILGCVGLLAAGGLLAVRTVITDLSTLAPRWPECTEKCQAQAKLFANDYNEMKDLSKAFLTLLIAVFVASVTFSEKIVDLHNAQWWSKGAMIVTWLSLLGAIVCCGTGLAYMVIAFGISLYQPAADYWAKEERAVYLFVGSGVLFGLSLTSMLIAGLNSLVQKVKPATVAAAVADVLDASE